MKSLLLASVVLAVGTLGAAAQSSTSPSGSPSPSATPPFATGNISAATHCRNASGQAQLKSASGSAMGGTSGSTTGSANSGSAGSSSGMSGSSSAPSGTGSSAAASLPAC